MDMYLIPILIETVDIHNEGAGQTLEYSYQDWCLSQMAICFGKEG